MSEYIQPMPAIFFGHGSPMNALGGPFADSWRALGESLPKPKAVLMVSAHWFIDGVAVTAQEQPRTIHDFCGFPKDLYDIAYPAPGDTWLAERVRDLLSPLPVAADHDWGLDHGTWSVLMHAFPDADVPVIQLSIDRRQPPQFHYEIGRRLAELRDEGVLIAGSGDVVHNLRLAQFRGPDDVPPYDWAVRFNEVVKTAIADQDDGSIVDYLGLGQDAILSSPTPEHYLPLLYVLGARRPDERAHFFNDEIIGGSISMLSVVIGKAPQRA